ncbi:MAG: drug/metabolite transporter (DMT)-like permease [Gammaproteobacteria bacterium]
MLRFRGFVPLAYLFLIVIWGHSWVMMKIALANAGPITFAAQRTFLAAVVLLAVLPILGRRLRPVRIPETIMLGIVQTTIFVTCSQLSLVDGGVGRSAVLVFTMPFWTILLAAFLLGERLVATQYWAVGLAAVGLISILEPWALSGSVQSKLIALLAGFAWAASAIIVKRMQRHADVDLISLTAWQLLFGSVVLIPIALSSGEPPTVWTPEFLGVLVFTAVLPSGLGWVVWFYLLQRLSAGVASITLLAIPVFATASSAYHLGDRMDPNETVGMVLIILALAMLSWIALVNRPDEVA